MALGGLIAFATAEVVLRSRSPVVTRYEVWWPHLHKVMRPVPGLLPGVDGEKHFVVNSLGLRGEEFSDRAGFRMLALGGSTTECLFLDQDEAWPEQVAQRLEASGRVGDVWIGNAGKSGLHTRDHVIQLRRLRPQLAELGLDAVLLLVGVNDLGLRLGEGEEYDPAALADPDVVRSHVLRGFQRVPLAEERRLPFWKRSALYRTFAQALDRRLGRCLVQDSAGLAHETWREHRADAPRLHDELPDLSSGLAEYRRNLVELVGLCADLGARAVLITQPSLWREDLTPEERATLWLGGIGPFMNERGCEYYSAGALREGLERYNEATRQVASQLGVEVIDLGQRIPADLTHFYDDVHFNEAGSAAVAQVVADHLLGRAPFDT